MVYDFAWLLALPFAVCLILVALLSLVAARCCAGGFRTKAQQKSQEEEQARDELVGSVHGESVEVGRGL